MALTLGHLRLCNEMWGACELRSGVPPITRVAGAIYLPMAADGRPWGVYDAAGRRIDVATDFRGPDGEARNQPVAIPLASVQSASVAPEPHYLYGGTLHLHYGHFLVNSLSRLWQLHRADRRVPKILFHGPGTLADWFARSFIRDMFEALRIAPESVAMFDEPTCVASLSVPHPSFAEQSFAYEAFGRLGAAIGGTLAGREPSGIETRPVFLSKTRLQGGVGRVVNEIAIEDGLRAHGVDIVHPETLSLREQVRLFASRCCIVGVTGSAFHTGLLQPPPGRVICVSPTPGPNSNFHLLDLCAGYEPAYYYAPGSRVVGENSDGFLTSMEFADPAAIVADLLRLIGD